MPPLRKRPRPEPSAVTDALQRLYGALLARFGPQDWWPADTPFEMAVGAVLTQNTNWENVRRAIAGLKAAGVLNPHRIAALPHAELAGLLRPAGYFNVKARRLRNLVDWLIARCEGELPRLLTAGVGNGRTGVAVDPAELDRLREDLLSVNGVGRETADSILLYGLHLPTFVVDAYTGRLLRRHGLVGADADYEAMRRLFMAHLPADVPMWQEYHALIVAAGKHHCKPTARCEGCPLEDHPHDARR